jgi:AraC-like DNA-binding protein
MNSVTILDYGLFDSRKTFPHESETKPRTVQYFEFDYILSCDARGMSYVEEQCHGLMPNLLIARKPGQVSHSALHYKCYYMRFQIQPEDSLYDSLMQLPTYLQVLNKETYRELFIQLFRHLVKANENKCSLYAVSKLLELIYNIQKDAAQRGGNEGAALHKEAAAVQKAIRFMKKNFAQRISLQDLGALTGYSPNHFRTVFSAGMNMSPQKYLEKIRIDNAKFLLVQGEMPIADIAESCGFASQSYFTKVFKEHTLLTPNEFSKAMLVRYQDNL